MLIVLIVSSVGASLGCTSRERPAPSVDDVEQPECTPTSPAQHPLPVITTLVTRDHEITVYASDDGLRFSVALADGALVGRMLTATELEQRFPALHRRFDATFAGDAQWLDASLDVGPNASPRSTLGSSPTNGPVGPREDGLR